jgi:hypothetical protein
MKFWRLEGLSCVMTRFTYQHHDFFSDRRYRQ